MNKPLSLSKWSTGRTRSRGQASSRSFALALCVLLGMASISSGVRAQQPQSPCWNSSWDPGFDHSYNRDPQGNAIIHCVAPIPPTCISTTNTPCHSLLQVNPQNRLNAIHASLIPKGDKKGRVIVWGHEIYLPCPCPNPPCRYLLYAIIDVSTTPATFENFCLPLPRGPAPLNEAQDPFCAGHAWTANGDLLVAGGTTCHQNTSCGAPPCAAPGGAVLVYLWQPPTSTASTDGGTWVQQPDLATKRWYPSVLALNAHPLLDDDRMMIAGGSDGFPGGPINFQNNYEVWVPPPFGVLQGTWENNHALYAGTVHGTNNLPIFTWYPRMHVLKNAIVGTSVEYGRVAVVGMPIYTDRLAHYPISGGTLQLPDWVDPPSPWWTKSIEKTYGSSVLAPILAGGTYADRVYMFGGRFSESGAPQNLVERSAVGLYPGPEGNWSTAAPMQQPRWLLNTVLLPDTRILVLGGEQVAQQEFQMQSPAYLPEVFDPSQAAAPWRSFIADTIPRPYHSTSLLLEDGRIFTGGSDCRVYAPPNPPNSVDCTNYPNPPSAAVSNTDYRILSPDYVYCGQRRPVIQSTGAPGDVYLYSPSFSTQTYDITFNWTDPVEGITIQRVTLVRPGSVPHHCDPNQRCVELSFVVTDTGKVRVTMPTKDQGVLPRGYYMLFLISSEIVNTQGKASKAAWVQVL